MVVGIEREKQGKQKSAWLGHGNQWLGGQKANAIREPNEADSKPAEPAPMHTHTQTESHLELGAFYLSSGQQTRFCKHNKATSITSTTTSLFFFHSTQTIAWLYLLIRAPETEMDEFHFDFSAVLFERKNNRSRKRIT